MSNYLVSHNTPACLVCGERSVVQVSASDLAAWKAGVHIQVVFPDLTADQRELLQTGTHPACWDSLVPEDDGEDEFDEYYDDDEFDYYDDDEEF
jgi:hypothetical protein